MNRIPFHYQISENDCFPTSVMNALICLYKRDEIPAEVIRMVYLLSLDDPRKEMSTKEGAKALITWLNEYSKNQKKQRKTSFSIEAEILEEKNMNLRRDNKICKCLDEGGVVLCDIWHSKRTSHTILALKHDSEWIYFWDPYRVTIPEECKKYVIRACKDEKEHNLRINKKWLDKDNRKKYTFYKKDGYCILLWNR